MSAIFGQVETLTQANGPDVQLRIQGDEFYARYETLDGYTVVYDYALGLYCYATLDQGEFLSSGIDIASPTPTGLLPHLKESQHVRDDKMGERLKGTRPPDLAGQPIVEAFGPDNGLLEGRKLHRGKVVGLTILVDFQDVRTSTTAADVDAMLNGEGYTENGNYCSVRDYFHIMSGGQLDYQNIVVGPILLDHDRDYYIDNLLAEEALNRVVDMGIDLAQFDSHGEHILDAVSFMYAGRTVYENWLWPHNFYLEWEHAGYRTHLYQITSLGQYSGELRIGTFCHESGHMLCRFPDLYDYGRRDGDFERSSGIGYYCLMGYGNHSDGGRTPAPVCGYLRYLAGWCTNEVDLHRGGSFTLPHDAYDTAFIYRTPYDNEYFLVENRSQLDLDAALPASGLAVYHCDIYGSNELQAGSPARHYQCALLQADGRFDLETNVNQGDAEDLYTLIEGNVLTADSTPSSRLWNGDDSGLAILSVGLAGAEITMELLPSPISEEDDSEQLEMV